MTRAISHKKKLEWMAIWCAKNAVALSLEGEVGFGRECVGILSGTNYPDYEWFDSEYRRVDPNGDVWLPENAYHKHPCVAVLGRGKAAETQLYAWLQWFDRNGFKVESTRRMPTGNVLQDLFSGPTQARMVKA